MFGDPEGAQGENVLAAPGAIVEVLPPYAFHTNQSKLFKRPIIGYRADLNSIL
jgi:hypothetical protein